MGKKHELSIEAEYCSDWSDSIYPGIREFVQNGRDAMREGFAFDMVYNKESSCLKLITKGTTLSHQSLLLGNSTKRGVHGMLGKWGEGYKIGSLALLRMGKQIKIRTGQELWVPEISHSKKYDAKVLVFDITSGKSERNEIVVEILGITESEWADLRWRFLFLGDHKFDIVNTKLGNVVLDGKGEVFVDGIWVCTNMDLLHGYDFLPSMADLDRDRRLVDAWHTQTLTARIWEQLYIGSEYVDIVDGMLANDKPDVKHFQHSFVVSEATRKKVADQFIKKHGAEAIPVQSSEDIRGLAFYGKEGKVVTSQSLRAILEKEIGSVESVKKVSRDVIRSSHNIENLSSNATRNLLMATKLVNEATGIMFPYEIVDFADPNILGLYKGGKMMFSAGILESFQETIKTLVEEISHNDGADGTREFQERMHTVYTNMLMIQLNLAKPIQSQILSATEVIIEHPSPF